VKEARAGWERRRGQELREHPRRDGSVILEYRADGRVALLQRVDPTGEVWADEAIEELL
jgi:hypothetical protein